MTLYLDTSSLVKMYVAEPGSEGVRAHVDRATIVAYSSNFNLATFLVWTS